MEGWKAFRSGNIEMAIYNLDRSISMKPDYVDAHYLLGQIYQFRAAQKNRLEVRNQGVVAAETLYVGKYKRGTEDLNLAVNHFQIVLQLQPKSADAMLDMATCFDNLGRKSDAEASYKKVFELSPNSDFARNAYNNLGLLYISQKKYKLARECYEKALAIDPTFIPARMNLEKIYNKK